MSGHTPAPWVVLGGSVVAQSSDPGFDYEPLCIADCDMDVRIDHDTTGMANARLIAAAPDLLAALRGLLPEGWGDDDTMDHMPGVKAARLAIAKAQP